MRTRLSRTAALSERQALPEERQRFGFDALRHMVGVVAFVDLEGVLDRVALQ